MQQEADAQKLDVTDRVGGIIFDEMSVQEDLVAIHRPGNTTLSGQVDYGNAAADTAVKQRESELLLLQMQKSLLISNFTFICAQPYVFSPGGSIYMYN